MATTSFVPNIGRMPVLGALPAALQLPVALLGQLHCVDNVVTENREHTAIVFIAFKYHKSPEFTRALHCFRGLRPLNIEMNRQYAFMMLTLAH